MTLFGYRLGLRLFALIGLLTLLVFVFGLDPGSLSAWGIAFFFASVLLEATAISVLLLLFLYEKALGSQGALYNIGVIFRQGALVGLFLEGCLIFRYLGVLAWWNVLLLLAFLLLLELSFRRLSSQEA